MYMGQNRTQYIENIENYQWTGLLFLFFILTVDVGSSTMNESFISYKVKTAPSVDLSGTIDKYKPQFTFLLPTRLGVPTCAMLVYNGSPAERTRYKKNAVSLKDIDRR